MALITLFTHFQAWLADCADGVDTTSAFKREADGEVASEHVHFGSQQGANSPPE